MQFQVKYNIKSRFSFHQENYTKIKKAVCKYDIAFLFSVRSSVICFAIMLLYTKTIVIANCNDKCEFLNQVLFPHVV